MHLTRNGIEINTSWSDFLCILIFRKVKEDKFKNKSSNLLDSSTNSTLFLLNVKKKRNGFK